MARRVIAVERRAGTVRPSKVDGEFVILLSIAICAAAFIAWIASRNQALYPVVFADEYYYSTDARLKSLRDAVMPGYLYLAVYRGTTVCGDGFLGCARLLNLAFFAGACGLVFACARRVVSRRAAACVGLIALASPFSTNTAYFMPESMYCFGFWLVMWSALRLQQASRLGAWAVVGVALGALSSIKPHGMFLVPAIVVYGACLAPAGWRSALRWLAPRVLIVLVAAGVTRYGIGFALAGQAGLTLFGSAYTSMAGGMLAKQRSLVDLALVVATLLRGHAMAIVFLFALPVAVLPVVLGSGPRRDDPRWRLAVMTVLVGVSLVGLSAVFTATVAGVGPLETIDRLHMRYYGFALPLLVMVGAAGLPAASRPSAVASTVIAVVAVCVIVVMADGFAGYAPQPTDAPELFGFAHLPTMRRTFAVLGLASLALLHRHPRQAAWFFLIVVMPWFLWKETRQIDDVLSARRAADRFDRAGIVTRRLLSPAEIGRLLVVVDDPPGGFRTLFHLNDPTIGNVLIAPGAVITASMWPASVDRLLIIGDHPVDRPGVEAADLGGFVLARRTGH